MRGQGHGAMRHSLAHFLCRAVHLMDILCLFVGMNQED